MQDVWPIITGLFGAGGGATLAAMAARALMRAEVEAIVSAALEKERAAFRERFATREDVLRLEAKIDVLIARLGG
jgi:uncharacterized membrane protein YdjX (TVP38/TMEM64 family)